MCRFLYSFMDHFMKLFHILFFLIRVSLLEATAKCFAFCNWFSIELFFRLHEKSPFCLWDLNSIPTHKGTCKHNRQKLTPFNHRPRLSFDSSALTV